MLTSIDTPGSGRIIAKHSVEQPAAPPADVLKNDYKPLAFMLCSSRCSASQRAMVLQTISSYRPEVLEDLCKFGVKIGFETVKAGQEKGHFSPLSKEIAIDASLPEDKQRATLLHELAHAHATWKRRKNSSFLTRLLTFTSLQDAPTCDPKFRRLYGDYLTKSAVDMAVVARDRIRNELKPDLTKPVEVVARPLELRYQAAECTKDGTETLSFSTLGGKRSLKGALLPLGLVGLATAKFVGLLALSPLLAVGAGLLGGYGLVQRAVRQHRDRVLESVDQQLTCPAGGSVEVKLRPGSTVVSMPAGQSKTGWLFSEYAAVSRKPGEYYADGVKHFLYSAESRQQLQQSDPGLFDYITAENLHSDWQLAKGIPAV